MLLLMENAIAPVPGTFSRLIATEAIIYSVANKRDVYGFSGNR